MLGTDSSHPLGSALGVGMEALAQTRAAPDPLDVETPLVALARSGAPLRRALAALAGRLVATSAWERLGFARLRDYAVERAGMSARQLQDLAHVDGALRTLPLVAEAFVAGRLSWTKARLLCVWRRQRTRRAGSKRLKC